MKNKILLVAFFATFFSFSQNKYLTYFEKGNGNQSANYEQVISFFNELDKQFQTVLMQEMGPTDSGKPLHIVVFSADKDFNYNNKNKAVVLINNAIHAGEPDGVDATMMLFRDLCFGKIKVPKNTIVVAIPVYNIGGMLNRNTTSRTNQNGPEEYGFRGNGRNFDLNRDMIKSDTKNCKSLVELFHKINPDIFIDNHVSNGADYQYALTYIQTEPDKLGNALGDFLKTKMTPALVADLKLKNIETTPYVDSLKETPDSGIVQFFDSPRYTTGYTSLFNCLGYVVETHMWKPYAQRVNATYTFMESVLKFADNNTSIIKEYREKNSKQYQIGDRFPIQWELDTTVVSKMRFLGFEASHKKSEVTTGNRLFYDRNKPYEKEIKFYPKYSAKSEVVIPKAYVVPQSWWTVIALLKENKCLYQQIKKDTSIVVENYKIASFKTSNTPYEGHYPHRNTELIKTVDKIDFSKGDFLFEVTPKSLKFLLETLEPQAIDSFFNWNFFDTILQQKEGYSDYVFEDLAAQILSKNPNLKKELQEKITSDEKFAKSPEAQLDWVHKHSKYYEKAHLQYPIYRVLK